MSGISVGELVKQAKGEDRSLREYARDFGVDAAILSKMINGTYLPKKPGIYEALTSPLASPRGGVTLEKMLAAAGATEDFQSGISAGMSAGMLTALADIPSSSMIKVLQARGIAAGGPGKSEAASAAMKPEEIRRIQRIRSDTQRKCLDRYSVSDDAGRCGGGHWHRACEAGLYPPGQCSGEFSGSYPAVFPDLCGRSDFSVRI